MKKIRNIFYIFFLTVVCITGFQLYSKFLRENDILRQVISRLNADSRAAEVLVTGVQFDETTKKTYTTIKFLEYDSAGKPVLPKYFTFSGNILQFQSLVIRFEDIYIQRGDWLKGKSAYIFWKVFMLDGKNTQEFEVNKLNEIPDGYKVPGMNEPFEKYLWQHFWAYALDPKNAKHRGIKNAQIEAPGTMFVPGVLYTIKIEHDGGLRIDPSVLSPILKGEQL